MNLGYFAADTLQMTLYPVKDRLVATEVHPLAFGPWRAEMHVHAESDVIGATEIGFWVTIEHTLRLYLVVREHEGWLFVLNTETLKTCGAETGFAGRTCLARLKEFKPAVIGVFRHRSEGWIQVPYDGGPGKDSTHALSDLDHDTLRQSPGASVARPADRGRARPSGA